MPGSTGREDPGLRTSLMTWKQSGSKLHLPVFSQSHLGVQVPHEPLRWHTECEKGE